jgi:hypothetical protein
MYEGPREATGGGGGEWEPNQIILQEPTYIPGSSPKDKILPEGDEHTNQQCRNDPLKVTNATEKMGSIGQPVSKICPKQ